MFNVTTITFSVCSQLSSKVVQVGKLFETLRMDSWIQFLVLAVIIGAAQISLAKNSTELNSSGNGDTKSYEDTEGEESASYSEPHPSLFRTRAKRIIVVEVVKKGQYIVLPCDVDGNPKPNKFTWRKNGKTIPKNNTYNIYEGSSLKITKLMVSDSADYTCKACNSLGCTDSTVTLRAFFKMMDYAMHNMSALVNSTATLHCYLQIQPNDNFSYKLFKRKFAEMKHLMDFSGTTDLLKTQRILTIEHVKLEDAGWYTCVAAKNHLDNIYEVIGHKSGYLHVVTKFERSYSVLIITVSVALVAIATCALLVIFGRRRVQSNNKYYPRWIKKITVTRNEENSDIEEFQIPIVTIHRSMIIENNLYKSASESEYEYPTDWEWEVQRCRISLGKLLGEGAFGQVVLAEAFGFLKGDKTVPVAVKMLKESHSDDDVENLVCELEIMKMVGRHPNVINLLGCCTNDGPLYVIMEHAIHGSLKGFLLEHILESDGSEKKKHHSSTISILCIANCLRNGVSFVDQVRSSRFGRPEHSRRRRTRHEDLRLWAC